MKIKFHIRVICSLALYLAFISCRKDEITPENIDLAEEVSADDYRWQYFGDWEFMSQTYVNDYMYMPDNTGGTTIVNNSHTDTNWINWYCWNWAKLK
jgi:predicted membrane protein